MARRAPGWLLTAGSHAQCSFDRGLFSCLCPECAGSVAAAMEKKPFIDARTHGQESTDCGYLLSSQDKYGVRLFSGFFWGLGGVGDVQDHPIVRPARIPFHF